MIPKNSTPIKNEILAEIFGKGLLTYLEMRITSYIIRWSWGFDGADNRRQDWTKPLTKSRIAKDINMNCGWCGQIINSMLKAGKLIINSDGQYQFNEHFENWEGIGKRKYRKAKVRYRKAKAKVSESESFHHYIKKLLKKLF